MYVVKRPFRNFGMVLTAGSVITEPADIKRFNGRLAEGKIIEVTEQTYESTSAYFKDKFGVVLPPITGETKVVEAKPAKTEQAKTETVKTTTKSATTVATKAVSK